MEPPASDPHLYTCAQEQACTSGTFPTNEAAGTVATTPASPVRLPGQHPRGHARVTRTPEQTQISAGSWCLLLSRSLWPRFV